MFSYGHQWILNLDNMKARCKHIFTLRLKFMPFSSGFFLDDQGLYVIRTTDYAFTGMSSVCHGPDYAGSPQSQSLIFHGSL
jgi:hypothetical protein